MPSGGILPDSFGSVAGVEWFGSEALGLTYKDPTGRVANRLRKQAPGDVLTIDELDAYLKIAKSTLYKLAQEGRLPGKKVGRHWRFRREAIDRWLESAPDSRGGGGT